MKRTSENRKRDENMLSPPFEHWLVLSIALTTTIAWLLSVYYAACRRSKTILKDTNS